MELGNSGHRWALSLGSKVWFRQLSGAKKCRQRAPPCASPLCARGFPAVRSQKNA